jgi:hypothetical protein
MSKWRYAEDEELFDLTCNFSIADWKIIRTNNYWKKLDSLDNIYAKKVYILKCVINYLRR